MRRGLVVSVALVGGCFTELPMMPGTGSDATASTASGGESSSGTSGTSGTGAPTGTTGTSGPVSETDVDPSTSGTTTAAPAEPEGLFACVTKLACAPWDCTGGCDAPGLEGMCVLSALRDRMTGSVEVARCDEDCALHLVVVRGVGTEDAQWQSRNQTEPATYSEVRTCTLKPPQFFADCLANFGPECADPAMWVVDCVEAEPICISGA